MKTIALFLSAVLIFLGGCDYKAQEKIKISSNPWVGFTPFSYAEKKGWLKDSPFEFAWSVDLSENKHLYDRGFTKGFTATQYEAMHIKTDGTIVPVFLIDKSYGADTIHSNQSVEMLKKAPKIKAYFESGTLNEDFFNAFIAKYGMKKSQFEITSISQDEISNLPKTTTPTLLISYEPYTTELVKHGFGVIESSATLDGFIVIDALFVEKFVATTHKKELQELQVIFERAKEALNDNPKEYYETIKGYLHGQSYEEFMASLAKINWLDNKNEAAKAELKTKSIDTRLLL